MLPPIAAHASAPVRPVPAAAQGHCPVLCHVTVAHQELKSRSFYMEFMPLAARGLAVRYVSPGEQHQAYDNIDFTALPARLGRVRQILATPSTVRALLRQRAGLYHFQDPELLPAAFVLKFIFRKHIVYDAYEDFPSMAFTSKRVPAALKPFVAKCVALIQMAAAASFDGVMTADPLTLQRMARTGKSKKLVFYNFPNLDIFPSPVPCPKPFDVVYRGGLSGRAGIWTLLDAIRLLKDRGEPVKALLVGYCDGPAEMAQLLRRIDALNLGTHFHILGPAPHSEMAKTLSRAKIGVSPLLDIPKFRRNIPVKVFEYWASGLPVISSDLRPIRPFFRNVRGGLLFPPGDSAAMAQSIHSLLQNPGTAAEMGRCGRRAVEERLNHNTEVLKLERFFKQIASLS